MTTIARTFAEATTFGPSAVTIGNFDGESPGEVSLSPTGRDGPAHVEFGFI